MDRFSKFHPIVSFSFFALAITLTLTFSKPLYLSASFLGALFYLLRLKGRSVLAKLFKFILPLILFVGVFNMIFVRRGETVLFAIGDYNFTREALIFGFNTGLMLASVIMWFDAYNEVVTSEKFMSLFGKIAPNLALLFCMVLRFIPLMEKTAREIKESQIGLGAETKGVKNTIKRFSALISISLERSVEAANSMQARGFGMGRRTQYSRFSFKLSDLIVLLFIAIFFALSIVFRSNLNIIPFLIYSLFPLASDLTEDAKWLYLKSKI